MKTIQNYFDIYSNLCQFEEGAPEYLVDEEDFKKALKEYALEVVQEDRKTIANKMKEVPLVGAAWNILFTLPYPELK